MLLGVWPLVITILNAEISGNTQVISCTIEVFVSKKASKFVIFELNGNDVLAHIPADTKVAIVDYFWYRK